ncbi:hypothetical protein N7497_006016 [Penicillium chrysogenum]|nr:hypothetical protein N7497_006016 [Penicillium chrysogenum]
MSQGPQVNMDFIETFLCAREFPEGYSREENPVNQRSHPTMEELDIGSPFLSKLARSVAIDPGMLSLESDFRQKHYLGSSSG